MIASHIMPWVLASNDERLNPANGVWLVGTLDRLFDNGFSSSLGIGAKHFVRRSPISSGIVSAGA